MRRVADVVSPLLLVVLLAVLELLMGRAMTYTHGPMRIWSGRVRSDENSQQISDPYTFTHLIHGAAFYGATWATMGGAPLVSRAIAAIAIESAWEAYENTDQVINRYRAETVSLGYYGDSVINSVCDVIACVLGFALAWKLPVRVTVAWVAAVEIILAVTIRDNLTLNILMLVHPIDAVKRWQFGG